MVYDLLEILFGNFLMEQEKKIPKCKTCKKRMEAQGRPWLFLLPVYSDERYHASADYFKKNCIPIRREEEIPTARRACRIWRVRCPLCGSQKMLVHDFLRVRKEENLENTYLYEYQEMVDLLYRQQGELKMKEPRYMEDEAYSTHISDD